MRVTLKEGDCIQGDEKDSNADTKAGNVDVKERTLAVKIESCMVADRNGDGDCEDCSICGGTPCHKFYGVDLIAAARKDLALEGHAERTYSTGNVASDLCRKRAHCLFVLEKLGYMGSEYRVKLPQCVLDGICSE